MTRDLGLRGLWASAALAVLAVVAPLPAAAQTAAEPAEPLGRLIFTPAQRAQLDVARKQRARATLATEETTEEVAQPIPQTITYDGLVRRSDGKTTVWINNRPIHDRAPAGGAAVVGRIGADGSVVLQVPQTGRSVQLKPGQSIELLSGTVAEGYARKPPEPEPKPSAKAAADAKGSSPVQREEGNSGGTPGQREAGNVVRSPQGTTSANSRPLPASPPQTAQ